MHLAGNMLFLLIFCSRVNSVIGNILTLILYPVLAVGAAFAHMQASVAGAPTPMIGASGAVMGMAGVYLLLFPVHRVYLTAWARWGLLAGFHLSFKVFSLRGFWVVLFYIMFDVVAVSLMVESTTAHWAHIGGMLFGLAAGLTLFVTRIAHSRSDMLSSILGKYAWPLIGSPHSHNKSADQVLNVRQTQRPRRAVFDAAAPDFEVVGNDLSAVRLSSFRGKVCVISSVPSLDTPVCDVQTRRFNLEAGKFGDDVSVLTISMDLPFAQGRWCGGAGVENDHTFSDHRDAAFGLAFGVLIKQLRLLARAVFVVDAEGIVRYMQIVPELTNEPDYEAVIDAVKGLLQPS